MKKYLWPLFALTLLITSCQPKIDLEKEKEAIQAVIEKETNSYYARDMDQQLSCFLQDETLIGLAAWKDQYLNIMGWEDMKAFYENNYQENPEPSPNKIEFANYRIKVHPESAWAFYDQNTLNPDGELERTIKSVRFLEKVNGEWKIAYISLVDVSSYEDETEQAPEEEEAATE
mgnify:CR=1 FL=1